MTKTERRRLTQLRRELGKTTRHRNRVRRLTASREPQPARVWLEQVGVDEDLARRFAPQFSRGVTPTAVGETAIKLHPHSRHGFKTVPVKRYSRDAFLRHLREYQPKDPVARREFARAAAAY